jgi:hypothetical protein
VACWRPNPTEQSCLKQCALMSQSNPPGRFCWVVRDGWWCPNPTSWSCMDCRPSCSGSCTPWIVRSLDQSYLVFGPGFPYKLCQLSSSNNNSGKCKFSPSIQKNIAIMVPNLASKFARMHTSRQGCVLHGKENTSCKPSMTRRRGVSPSSLYSSRNTINHHP